MKNPIRLARILKVLSVPARVRIVQLLKGRALCVNALASQLEVTQGAVSQHLRVLRDAGLVTDEKRGCYVHCRLNDRKSGEWRAMIAELLDPTGGNRGVQKGTKTCAAVIRRRKNVRNRNT